MLASIALYPGGFRRCYTDFCAQTKYLVTRAVQPLLFEIPYFWNFAISQ